MIAKDIKTMKDRRLLFHFQIELEVWTEVFLGKTDKTPPSRRLQQTFTGHVNIKITINQMVAPS